MRLAVPLGSAHVVFSGTLNDAMEVIPAARLRPHIIEAVERGMRQTPSEVSAEKP